MRNSGFGENAIFARLCEINQNDLTSPGTEAEMRQIAIGAGKWLVGTAPMKMPELDGEGKIKPEFQFEILTDKELDEGKFPINYLIEGILVQGQPCIIGAPKKSMKTSVSVDMGLSLTSGTPFLGKFKVNKKCRVGIMSAESGMGTLQETARRIRLSKGIGTQELFWCASVPKLDVVEHITALIRFIQEKSLDVIIFDPAYMMMCGLGEGASNLFKVGEFLAVVSDVAAKTGVTPIINHHTTKNAGREEGPLELESIAFAGFQEWARQWLLLNRRCRYDPDNPGHHELWMVVGGSAGHTGQWGIDIEEGSIQLEGGRTWGIEISSSSNIIEEGKRHRALVKENNKREKDDERRLTDLKKIIETLGKHSEGLTKTDLKGYSGVRSPADGVALQALLDAGKVKAIDLKKSNGQVYEGFTLVHDEI